MTPAIVIVVAFCTIGFSTVVWGIAALCRLVVIARAETSLLSPSMFYRPEEVAVLIAAHDEHLVIAEAVRAARALVPAGNVFVVSDGSSDETAARAREAGAVAWDLAPNRGKAGAIRAALERFRIPERFPLLLLLDADSRPRPDYLRTGLPLFTDESVVAVAGRATTAPDAATGRMGRVLTSYRERTYVCTQYLHKFGQAARAVDAVTIVPGFASMYRTDVLHRIDIDAPGLSIEDFNMTFEVHAKRLGRIAFHPACAVAETQDPAILRDYSAQMRRWSLGFWQTVRRHGLRRGLFWISVGVFAVETIVSSLVLTLMVPVVTIAALAAVTTTMVSGEAAVVVQTVATALPVGPLAAAFLVGDSVLTAFACVVTRTRPRAWMLLYPGLRVWDAMLCLRALVAAFGRPSDGRWRSPDRRAALSPAAP
ncbi:MULTISPECIES: glycosyltransferase family 2 protein [Microbacterium]|uniref:glycosyltransferase family 2 protein n=1 Tax=Microbacterium TaxID=33882 RepID=UPI0027866885|nr:MULTISPECIES: glycosyltransferase family 2 protein [Microbacterium]MDQ1084400.1 biofilm PGA synthesis N-glycosyltransferase PgaC [Microbacterium sp. SORGH_AS_0344]MDQ1170326.1 biofilm PGA synthesis N-glycosyltransferase PgaC [Microbacterium proteolyticum]